MVVVTAETPYPVSQALLCSVATDLYLTPLVNVNLKFSLGGFVQFGAVRKVNKKKTSHFAAHLFI